MFRLAQKTLGGRAGEEQRPGKELLRILLAVLFLFQFAVICYFNLTQIRNHLGYDSSWNILRAALVWDEKTLMGASWSETTNLHLDTPLLIASLLYGLTGNLLLSFGLADILVVSLLLCFVWIILERLQVKAMARLLAVNMVICPYLTTGFQSFNDLGYFSCLLSGASYYSIRTLLVLMIFYEFLKIVQDQKLGVLGWLLWPLCLLAGVSFGVFLIIILFIPYLAYELEMAAIRNDWKQLIRRESVFAYICCGCVLLGKILAVTVIHFVAMDSSRGWTSLEALWTNFGAVFQGLLQLLQVLPETVHAILSPTGLLRVFALFIFALVMTAVVSVFRRAKKAPMEKSGACLFLSNVVLLNFLVFGLFNVRYGEAIFEVRYLIPTFLMMVLITALFFDGLDARRFGSAFLSLVMAGSLLAVDLHSDVNYLRATNEAWQMEEIQALAESQGAGVVYLWGDDLTVVGRALRPCDLKRVYKELPDTGGYFIHWGDYTTYDLQEEYTGPTMLICPREKNLVPASVLSEYTLLKELDQVNVYGSDHNPKLF